MKSSAPSSRSLPIDRMRGLVMLLMVIDHAGSTFNANHVFTDSMTFYGGQPLPNAGFLSRWITHLCAPTFVLLAGVAIALSIHKRVARGATNASIDRYLLTRGAFIALLDPLVMSVAFLTVLWSPPALFIQVLFAIGGSLMLMVPLRRLPGWALVSLSVVILVANEWLFPAHGQVFGPNGQTPSPALAVAMTGGMYFGESLSIVVLYPLLPWLVYMMLGWTFGRWLLQQDPVQDGKRIIRVLVVAGLGMLAAFALVRWYNQWGNTGLPRTDGSVLQWLHVSKYPPGVAFALLELGLMSLCLGGFYALERAKRLRDWPRDPLIVFGQTALFFYLLHVPLLKGMAWGAWLITGADEAAKPAAHGLGATYLATVAALVLLYPLCTWYGRYKRAHPDGWTRYV